MSIPAGVETVTVSSGSPMTLPDGTLIRGNLYFTAPDINIIIDDDYIFGGRVTAELVDGEFSVDLVPQDATGVNPTGWSYIVRTNFLNAPNWTRSIQLTKEQPDVILADILQPAPLDPQFTEGFLPLIGGTMSGDIVLANDPNQPLEAATKRYVDNADNELMPLSGGTFTGPVNFNTGGVDIDIQTGFATTLSTGVVTGGSLDIASPTSVTINAFVGHIVDVNTNPGSPVVLRIDFPTTVVPLDSGALSRSITWWLCNSSGQIIQQASKPSATQRRTHIMLGSTAYDTASGQLIVDQSLPIILAQPANQLVDLMDALGPFRITGMRISANGANLSMNRTSGTMFVRAFNHYQGPTLTRDPHVVNVPAATPFQFRRSLRTPAVTTPPLVTTVDPANYDLNGTLTPVGGGTGTSTIQRIWLFGTADNQTDTIVQYGQSTYTSLSNAVAEVGSGAFVPNPLTDDAFLAGYLAVTRSATNLSDPTQAVFIHPSRFPTP